MGDDEFGGEDEENADVICMDTELAVRVFEYIAQNQLEGEELQAMADKMADLGNQSDDVLTVEHFDEITGGEQGSQDDMGDEFGEDDFPEEDGDDEFADDSMQSPEGEQDVEQDLEIGEDAFDGDTSDDQLTDEPKYGAQTSEVDPYEEKLVQQFLSGQMSREALIDALQSGASTDYSMHQGEMGNPDMRDDMQQGRQRMMDPYGDDVTDDFGEYDREDDDEEFDECMDYRLGEDAPPGQQQQNDPTIDAQYMNGYNTGKRGGQATPQNINTPQGSAYNSGFSDAKGGKPSVPPSKRQGESVREAKAAPTGAWVAYASSTKFKRFKTREGAKNFVEANTGWKLASSEHYADKIQAKSVKEGVETFASFLAKIDKPSPGVTTVAALFKAKKGAKTIDNTEDKHFEIVQDPKTTAVKITNDSTTGVHKTSNSY